ncbi:MAG: ATP-binding protein [Treponema sp.]|nr:ATP-binding protein [Treponema sp.]
MIVEFSIANTFSIKDRQTISFEAATEDERNESQHCVQIDGRRILKIACLYGANASGKTNILTALRFYMYFAIDSFTELKPNEATHFVPFRFDEKTAHEAGEFNLVFYMYDESGKPVLYDYELTLSDTRVIYEKLSYAPKGTKKLLYERNESGEVTWGAGITGAKKVIAQMTRPNCSVLSTAAQAQHPLFLKLYENLSKRFHGMVAPVSDQLSSFTLKRIEDDAAYKEKVIGMFNASDIGQISDIRIETHAIPQEFMQHMSAEMQDELARNPERAKTRRALFVHKYADKEYELPVGYESAGTLRMLELIAPLSDVMQHAFILIDELEMSLHEELVETFLRLFLEASEDSQLLFTTQDQDLLDSGLLRDDEIWFCYKTDSGNSIYNAITDYAEINPASSRKKLYQAGKFGALPVVDVSQLMGLFSAKKNR